MSLQRFLHLSECENGHYCVVMDTALPSCPICGTREGEIVYGWPHGQPLWGERLRTPEDIRRSADTPEAFLRWLSYCITSEHMQPPYGVRWLCPGVELVAEGTDWLIYPWGLPN